ncbi:peripheral-type benzodiazepine receptor-associated protein 1-like [Nothoprocta perdicaria]|uniref:peripheral-type benzodiazepine receptor-associated protein 1-like n=1 Tax=Nothoprocta perdicaria TaxID=30464 RepID=UPI000E1C0F7A|nr:peripheral-type benzodiazepine receptor-associated protein 1-like [Nothoprocta perdicaria]
MAVVTDTREGGAPAAEDGDKTTPPLPPAAPELGLQESTAAQSHRDSPWTLCGQAQDPQQDPPSRAPALERPLNATDGLKCDQTARSPQSGADYGFLVRQNTKLLSALEDLQHRCTSLSAENSLLRRSCFPETEEKVKHLKRKNAELAVIAKRLEERARKLQEANLKAVSVCLGELGEQLCVRTCPSLLVLGAPSPSGHLTPLPEVETVGATPVQQHNTLSPGPLAAAALQMSSRLVFTQDYFTEIGSCFLCPFHKPSESAQQTSFVHQQQ